MKKLTVIILMCLGLMACKKETTTPTSTNPTSTTPTNSNTLSGIWNYIHVANNINYKCNWTFNNDGTVNILDPYDGFNEQTVTYIYDENSKQLTIGGLVVYQLTWLSATKFSINSINREFTKSIFSNSDHTSSFDFTIDGKQYSWSGKYSEAKPYAVYKSFDKRTYIHLFNPYFPFTKLYPEKFYDLSFFSRFSKVGEEVSDSISSNPFNIVNLLQAIPNNQGGIDMPISTEKNGGYCNLKITQYDTIGHILKGSLKGVISESNMNKTKKAISGTFSVYLMTE